MMDQWVLSRDPRPVGRGRARGEFHCATWADGRWKPTQLAIELFAGQIACRFLGESPSNEGRIADYSNSVKEIVKVLDFVQLGGPKLTVGRTVFELWMGL